MERVHVKVGLRILGPLGDGRLAEDRLDAENGFDVEAADIADRSRPALVPEKGGKRRRGPENIGRQGNTPRHRTTFPHLARRSPQSLDLLHKRVKLAFT